MRRQEVLKAMQFSGPAYVPVYLFNKDQDQSDIVAIDVQHHFLGPNRDRSEWGFSWERLDETMGVSRSSPVQEWENLEALQTPDPAAAWRFAGVAEFNRKYPDRFRMANLGLSGFTTMFSIRGFDRLMEDLLLEPRWVETLADTVFSFEEALIAELPRFGFDAVSFFDDWGTQNNLLISPRMWRRVFKPRYARQFALAHSLGLAVYLHSCGQITEIIPDLIEIGVDLLNISQPNLYDIPELGRRFGGTTCFVCPVSYQTTSILGTREQIFEDVQVLVESLGGFGGGLVGYVEEYHSIGMTQTNYNACVEAFRTLGNYSG